MSSYLDNIYSIAKPIPEHLKYTNKYTFLLYNKIVEGKYIDINMALQNSNKALTKYVAQHNRVLVFPNILNNRIIGLYIRPLHTKGLPLKLGDNSIPYNLGQIAQNFSFGDTLILVEGIGDLSALKFLNKELNIIAMQSSILSNTQIETIEGLTDSIIIIPDNDQVGINSSNKLKRILEQKNISVKIVPTYNNLKDLGDILDIVLNLVQTNDSTLKEELSIIKTYFEALI